MFRLTEGNVPYGHENISLAGREFFGDAEHITDWSGSDTSLGRIRDAAVYTHVNYPEGVSIEINQQHEPVSRILYGSFITLVDTFGVSVSGPDSDEPIFDGKVWSQAWIIRLPFYEQRAAKLLDTAGKIAQTLRCNATE